MKLRIQGNTLRLRLTQKEVSDLYDQHVVESAIHFPSGRALRYLLVSTSEASEVSAEFEDDYIRILTPLAIARTWAESDEVAIEGSRDSSLRILIEKDFQCLHNPEEWDPDAYPNPLSLVEA